MNPHTEMSNFLDQESYNKLKEFLNNKNTPWYTREGAPSVDWILFTHYFHDNFVPQSQGWPLIFPILEKLKCKGVIQVRANLTFKKEKRYEGDWHTDYEPTNKTAILYFTTCDGYTLLDRKKQYQIKAEENKLLIFPGDMEHRLVSQLDTEKRTVFNINYYN